jgi:hypothetical protein
LFSAHLSQRSCLGPVGGSCNVEQWSKLPPEVIITLTFDDDTIGAREAVTPIRNYDVTTKPVTALSSVLELSTYKTECFLLQTVGAFPAVEPANKGADSVNLVFALIRNALFLSAVLGLH